MATTEVEVVSPAKVLFTGQATMVVCRSVDGEIAFLADHIPYLGALEANLTRVIAEDDSETRIAVSGGFVEVRDNRVVILADRAELADDIDVEAARTAARAGDPEDPEVRWAQIRLEAAGVTA